MAARSIHLRRAESNRVFVANRGDAFRLKVTAEDAVGMPNEIFLHAKVLIDPDTEQQGDDFVSICSPIDLTVYPANAPDESQFPQFFRKSQIDILVPGQTAANEAWTAIYSEVEELVRALNRLDVLVEVETVFIGTQPDDDVEISISLG